MLESDAGSERDYLVGTQLEVDPDSFASVVKEAFLLEYNCVHQKEIAEILGVDKSRITQIRSSPKSLQPETISMILTALESRVHRRRVIEAWCVECFGKDDATGWPSKLTGHTITDRTVRRIDRSIRESRLDIAAATADEALGKTTDHMLREQLLDRAFFVRHRLNQPGQALMVARQIVDGAKEAGDTRRVATGVLNRARVLSSVTTPAPALVRGLLSTAEGLLRQSPPIPSPRPAYVLVDEKGYLAMRLGITLTFIERGLESPNTDLLRQELATITKRLKTRQTLRDRSRDSQLAARIHLALSETFQAEEFLDQSFNAGDVKNLQIYEMAGLIKGRILARTDPGESSSRYLATVSNGCFSTLDLYHGRLAEETLLENEVKLIQDHPD